MTNRIILVEVIFRALVALIAVCGATYLMSEGIKGWGWLIFVAIVCGGISIKI